MKSLEFNENQKKAINFYEGCCNVIAAAGSGKTSVLVHRIYNLVMNHNVNPNNILAITFSKKAKENMLERLKNLMPDYYSFLHIETFHSFGYSLIRKFDNKKYQILDTDWKKNVIIENICKEVLNVKEINGLFLANCLGYISNKKNHLQFPDSKNKDMFERIYTQYEKHKLENVCLDFDDMLTHSYEILSNNSAALEYCQEQYRFILADEMQDTNEAQYNLLRMIAQKYQNIFFVDDPLQNIFEWRNSDNRYVLEFDNEWDKNTTIINLNCNYRSHRDIVDLANKFAKTVPEADHRYYVESISDKDYFKDPQYQAFFNEREEADEIAQKISQMKELSGYQNSDFAILTRTNAQLLNFETSMYRAGIPYLIVDGISFVDRMEVKIVLSYLILSYDLSDKEAFQYIYNKPSRYLGKKFLDDVERVKGYPLLEAMQIVSRSNKRYVTGVKSLSDTISCLRERRFATVKDQIAFLRKFIDLDSFVSREMGDSNNRYDKVDNLNSLESMATLYASAEEFVSAMKQTKMERENGNVVKLMTIHKSKGLEFPVVFLPGVNEGLLPHANNENINEERRLMYVAITRAEKELYISSTSQYRGKETAPSRFIKDLFSKK